MGYGKYSKEERAIMYDIDVINKLQRKCHQRWLALDLQKQSLIEQLGGKYNPRKKRQAIEGIERVKRND
jgi:hypothetical protein